MDALVTLIVSAAVIIGFLSVVLWMLMQFFGTKKHPLWLLEWVAQKLLAIIAATIRMLGKQMFASAKKKPHGNNRTQRHRRHHSSGNQRRP